MESKELLVYFYRLGEYDKKGGRRKSILPKDEESKRAYVLGYNSAEICDCVGGEEETDESILEKLGGAKKEQTSIFVEQMEKAWWDSYNKEIEDYIEWSHAAWLNHKKSMELRIKYGFPGGRK